MRSELEGAAQATAVSAFSDRLAEAVENKRSQLVVGLDPRVESLPVELRGGAQLGRAALAEATARFAEGSSTPSRPRSWR